MDASKKRTVMALNRLTILSKNSEEGFRVAAESVKNRGLKTLLKTYAQQRAQFVAELQAEVKRLGGRPMYSSSFLGVIHRGWIIIKAALTLGQHSTESVILDECQRGEDYAVRHYEKALQKDLLPEVRSLVERQGAAVRKAAEQISRLRGGADGRVVIRLFDSEEDANRAVHELESAGFVTENIRTMSVEQAAELYESDIRRNTLLETASAGGLGGAVFGGILGLIASLLTGFVPGLESMMIVTGGTTETLAVITLGSTIVGALFGAFMGILMGVGVSQEDSLIYDDSVRHGKLLMLVQAPDNNRAVEASKIMRQVNLARANR